MKPALLLLALPLVGCVDVVTRTSVGAGSGGAPPVVGTGKPIVQSRSAQAAATAEFSGPLQVFVRKGSPKLTIEAQKEILPLVKSKFENGTLRVWTEGSLESNAPMRVTWTTPEFSGFKAGDAATVDVKDMSGENARIELSEASTATVQGKIAKLVVKASGASRADLRKLEAQNATANAAEASTIRVWAERLDAEASGASTIRQRPATGSVTSLARGSSTIGFERGRAGALSGPGG